MLCDKDQVMISELTSMRDKTHKFSGFGVMSFWKLTTKSGVIKSKC